MIGMSGYSQKPRNTQKGMDKKSKWLLGVGAPVGCLFFIVFLLGIFGASYALRSTGTKTAQPELSAKIISALPSPSRSDALLPSPSTGSTESGMEGTDIKIGAIMPMTGDVSIYGTSAANAINLALDKINAAGGVNGRKLTLYLEDDQNIPEKTVESYKKLVSEGVDVIIGSVASKCTLAIAPLAEQSGIPLITTASTNVDVTKPGGYVFRACFIDSYQGVAAAKFALANLGKKKAAILINGNNAYSQSLAQSFQDTYEKMGGKITDRETYSSNADVDTAMITRIKESNPDVIFIPDYYGKVSEIAKLVRAAGMLDEVVLLGGDGWDGIANYAGPEVAGSYFVNHYTPDSEDPDVVAFVASYKARYGDTPNALAALGYDAMDIVAKAIASAESTDHKKVRDAIAHTNGKFVTGRITFDSYNNPIKSAVIIAVYWEDGILGAKYYDTLNP
jgi:branched-chain amino acid transport system substrate-binding protein